MYRHVAKRLNATVIPLTLETYGAMGEDWIAHNKKLAEIAAAKGKIKPTDKAKAAYRRLLTQEISICLHRGNARLIREFVGLATQRDVHAHRLQLRQDAFQMPPPPPRHPRAPVAMG